MYMQEYKFHLHVWVFQLFRPVIQIIPATNKFSFEKNLIHIHIEVLLSTGRKDRIVQLTTRRKPTGRRTKPGQWLKGSKWNLRNLSGVSPLLLCYYWYLQVMTTYIKYKVWRWYATGKSGRGYLCPARPGHRWRWWRGRWVSPQWRRPARLQLVSCPKSWQLQALLRTRSTNMYSKKVFTLYLLYASFRSKNCLS